MIIEKDHIEITKENIHLHYEFMSNKEKKENMNLIHFSFNIRSPLSLMDKLNMEQEDLLNFWKYKVYRNGRVSAQSYFGIKDKLKPIDEYIAEIKESRVFKEYSQK